MGNIFIYGATCLLLVSILLSGLTLLPGPAGPDRAVAPARYLERELLPVGIAIMQPGWWSKMLLLILFIVFTNPVSSHAIARSAHFVGIPISDRGGRG